RDQELFRLPHRSCVSAQLPDRSSLFPRDQPEAGPVLESCADERVLHKSQRHAEVRVSVYGVTAVG
ncbi:MAG: hypothetical protein ACJ79B_01900, partial [Gemmatimonadaceae bacterium]